ncbi:nodulation protein NolG [Vandammella animalimorsus]|uniref:Nodulation protein NolG n=1 Tax=Vandammella animalimorsus TaxID=2029117 RepID=A0A2A2T7H5_9BURK|nr:efflux RND transporter permease subunit [Vandammella animalimorsus]PAT32817.1 nodulation protein NolG [Vandammella animalimorsus]PAX17846.1 nodulation protein NolG [Vandammella animalimorsus]PAX20000.1 nodulation protein NolG [Vandammella animalimorsus]
MWFTRVSLHNPVMATMVMLAFIVLGGFSYQRLKVDQFPSIEFPVVVVVTRYPGASAEIVESEVTEKIEQVVNTIAGISQLSSRSYDNVSVVIVQFALSMDGRRATEDVREKIAGMRSQLREEVEDPAVQRFDPEDRPIWSLALVADPAAPSAAAALPAGTATNLADTAGAASAAGTTAGTATDRAASAHAALALHDPVALTNWAEQVLKRRLENVRGVGAVQVLGGVQRRIHIELQPQALRAWGLSAQQVADALEGENQDLPLGSLRSLERERLVQLDARVAWPADFGELIVARRGGAPVYLRQLAQVRDGAAELDSLALFNGQRTLLLSVQKAQDENTIEVVDGLNAVVAELQAQLPAGLRLQAVSDDSRPIRVAVASVQRTLLEGALLTVLIVYLFLNSWRSTIITGLTLPIALVGTFMFMGLLGFSINMLTLMALSLCVGLLIDDAIVVRENIVRHLQMGKSAYDAALQGTQEIGLAVLATTLCIVAVFLPIGFMGGIIGKFFHEFGLTIAAAVLISMFVAFTLDPMLSSVWHDPQVSPALRRSLPPQRHGPVTGRIVRLYQATLGRLTRWFARVTEALSQLYQDALRWALDHRLLTLALAALVFVLSLFMLRLLGTEFVPASDYSEATIEFHTPMGSSIEHTQAKARQVDAIVRALPEVRYTVTRIGNTSGKHQASMYVRLVERQQRTRSVNDMALVLRRQLAEVAGIRVTHVGLLDPVGGQKELEFSLKGPDLGELGRITAQLQRELEGIPGLVDLDARTQQRVPIVSVQVQRQAASALGLHLQDIAAPLRVLLAGQSVGNWRAPDGQTYDLRLGLAPQARQHLQDLAQLPLNVRSATAGDQPQVVTLGQVAQLHESNAPNVIDRHSMQREVRITANTALRSLGEVSADVERVLQATPMPPGYGYSFGGAAKDMAESFQYALMALALAVVFIYMVLASQFQSFLQPITLMMSLPLTLIGVAAALLVFGSRISMISVIGIVMLMGLVTKNAILLVDFANRARQPHDDEDGRRVPGLPRDQALLKAARVRLRPILMTTLAMVFGMLPLALSSGEGSEAMGPLGQSVIGGVITSSVLTLVVVPVVYGYLDDLGAWCQRLWQRTHL